MDFDPRRERASVLDASPSDPVCVLGFSKFCHVSSSTVDDLERLCTTSGAGTELLMSSGKGFGAV